MKLLAIETSTDACSCALWLNGDSCEQFTIAPRTHGALILSMIDALLAESELSLNRLDGLAFGCGPGSFTGLRIAAGVIQGLAFAVDLPVAAISSLAAVAQAAPFPVYNNHRQESAQVLAIQDARMGEVYCGTFRRDADNLVKAATLAQVCRPEQIVPPPGTGIWTVVGGGWQVHGTLLAQALREYELIVLSELVHPHAREVACLGATALATGQGVTAEQALPLYLRDNVAVIKPTPILFS